MGMSIDKKVGKCYDERIARRQTAPLLGHGCERETHTNTPPAASCGAARLQKARLLLRMNLRRPGPA